MTLRAKEIKALEIRLDALNREMEKLRDRLYILYEQEYDDEQKTKKTLPRQGAVG